MAKKKKIKYGYCSESARLKRERSNITLQLKRNEKKINELMIKFPNLDKKTIERMVLFGEL
jgi:seryl-tRNA synthetase